MEPSPREVCAFEAGIKLGMLFHQFIGTPVSEASRRSLEEAMRRAVLNQPYVSRARVRIKPEPLRRASQNTFGYASLSPEMLEAEVGVEYRGVRCVGRLSYSEDEAYPVMWVEFEE
ncbi:dihydroneopterin aldolase family protein [Candidatus Pyrohabitans sp.]